MAVAYERLCCWCCCCLCYEFIWMFIFTVSDGSFNWFRPDPLPAPILERRICIPWGFCYCCCTAGIFSIREERLLSSWPPTPLCWGMFWKYWRRFLCRGVVDWYRGFCETYVLSPIWMLAREPRGDGAILSTGLSVTYFCCFIRILIKLRGLGFGNSPCEIVWELPRP